MSSEQTLAVVLFVFLAGKKLLGLDAWAAGPRASGGAAAGGGECGKGSLCSVDQDKGPVPAGEMTQITEVDLPNALAVRGEGSSCSSRGSERAGGGEEEEGSSAGSGRTCSSTDAAGGGGGRKKGKKRRRE